jgi:hypothetical protein
MPGQPIRARARFQFPPAIHPRELPAATGVTAIIIRQALRFPRLRCTHCHSQCCGPQPKNISPLCRNCGRWDFPVEA